MTSWKNKDFKGLIAFEQSAVLRERAAKENVIKEMTVTQRNRWGKRESASRGGVGLRGTVVASTRILLSPFLNVKLNIEGGRSLASVFL